MLSTFSNLGEFSSIQIINFETQHQPGEHQKSRNYSGPTFTLGLLKIYNYSQLFAKEKFTLISWVALNSELKVRDTKDLKIENTVIVLPSNTKLSVFSRFPIFWFLVQLVCFALLCFGSSLRPQFLLCFTFLNRVFLWCWRDCSLNRTKLGVRNQKLDSSLAIIEHD